MRLPNSVSQISNTAWLTPDVLPYGAFVERLYSDAVVPGAVSLQALQREQELQLWRQIIERSTKRAGDVAAGLCRGLWPRSPFARPSSMTSRSILRR